MALKQFELGPLQKKWLEALRSGKYTQTTGKLHDLDEGGYCCLGVACSLISEPTISKQFENDGNPKAYWGKDKDEQSFEVLPVSYRKKLKFFDSSGGFDTGDLTLEEFDLFCQTYSIPEDQCSLAELNDSGWSFKSLANLIEEYPHLIFSGPA